jgi:hypothetical protein
MRAGGARSIGAVALIVAASAADAAVSASPCPETVATADADLQRAYVEFRRSVQSSPLVRYPGRPVACTARVDGGALRLTYQSPSGARFEAQRDPAIELTEQRLSETGVPRAAGLALLQRTERWAFGDRGCAIAWKAAPEEEAGPAPGHRALVYRGEDCNCQARLVYRGAVLTDLIFRSAC